MGANVIISSGGVSMGDRDFVKPVLERSGTVHFGKARPLTHGTRLTFSPLIGPEIGEDEARQAAHIRNT